MNDVSALFVSQGVPQRHAERVLRKPDEGMTIDDCRCKLPLGALSAGEESCLDMIFLIEDAHYVCLIGFSFIDWHRVVYYWRCLIAFSC